MASAEDPAILVSACLLGVRCNHRGGANRSGAVEALAAVARLIPVCPESMGGLPTPRPAAEIQPGGRVVNERGVDVTDAYERGARATVALALATGAQSAVLKARSPSCGCGQVYDGRFRGRLRPGLGVSAQALVTAGLTVRSEEDVEAESKSRD